MSPVVHQDLAAGGWFQLSLAEQLGNVGSELSRALKWRDRNPQIAQRAVERVLELMDLTLADPRHRTSVARLREIARAREVLVDFPGRLQRVPVRRARSSALFRCLRDRGRASAPV